MVTVNMTVLWGNFSTTEMDSSHPPEKMSFVNLAAAIFIWVSLLVGTVSNALFLWVLEVKMKRTVNTLWFSHLISTYLLYCSFLPVFSVYVLLDHWVFGVVVCKLINTFFSLTMFATVFLLTVISLDRYLLICHPVWSQRNRTIPRAWRVVSVVWLVSSILSAPYLAFREIREVERGRKKCLNNYAFSSDWEGPEMEALRARVHSALFVVRFLLAFLLPFLVITGCHCRMGLEMKKKRLVRNRKPFRVLVAAVVSFFICWLPYHLYHSSPTYWESFSSVQQLLRVTMVLGECFNFCFTPILYLFVGEKFQQVFKTSILALVKRGFMDIPIVPADDVNANREGRQACTISSSEPKISCENDRPSP